MDVYSDGTWYLDDEGYEDEGTWYVSNGELTMYDEWGDLYGTAYISGDTLYLDWIYWGDMELYMVQ